MESEDDDGIQELALKPDHSLRSLNTFKKELVQPSVIEETGTWQLRDNHITLNSTVTWNKQCGQIIITLLRLTRNTLATKNFNGTKTLTYKRLELPVCADSRPTSGDASLREAELIGSWRIHYSTHDYQFRFMPENRYSLLGLILGKSEVLMEGSWYIDRRSISVKPEKTPHGAADELEQKWTVTAVGKDCFTIRQRSERSSTDYTLQRLR